MSIKYVWFDLGYTLVHLKRDTILKNVLSKNGYDITLEDSEFAFHITDKLFMREYRDYLYKTKIEFIPFYLYKLLEYLKIKVDINKALKDYFHEEEIQKKEEERTWVAYEGSVDVLSMLKHNSIGLGLISNWDDTARLVLRQNKLDSILDNIIISSEVGYEKPDPKIFKLALKAANLNPDECLFVGDNYYDDVLGSKKVNMNSVLINPYGRNGIEEVENIDIISNISCLPKFLEENYQLKLN